MNYRNPVFFFKIHLLVSFAGLRCVVGNIYCGNVLCACGVCPA